MAVALWWPKFAFFFHYCVVIRLVNDRVIYCEVRDRIWQPDGLTYMYMLVNMYIQSLELHVVHVSSRTML